MKTPCRFGLALAVPILFATVEAQSAPAAYELTATLRREDAGSLNAFRGVAMSDDYLLVSAPSLSLPGNPGQVFLFDVTGEHLLQTFTDPTPGTLGFGGAASDGQRVVITEYFPSPATAGRAFVYDAVTGQLQQTLTTPDPGFATFAGGDLAIGGNSIVLGAYGLFVGPFGPRYPAKIFVFDADTGALRHTLDPPAGINSSPWGELFAVSGNLLAVGTPDDLDSQVLFYDLQTGQLAGVLSEPQVRGYDTLIFRENKLLLGKNRGDAFLLDLASEQLLTIPFPDPDPDVSGSLLALSGENVLVGSFGSLSAGATTTPRAWLFDGATGELLQTLNDAAPGDRFVSMTASPSGGHLAVVKNFDNEILVYTRVAEPTGALVTLLAVGAGNRLQQRRMTARR